MDVRWDNKTDSGASEGQDGAESTRSHGAVPPLGMLGPATSALGAGAVQRKLAQRLLQRRAGDGARVVQRDKVAGTDTVTGDQKDGEKKADPDAALRKEFDSFSVKGNVEGGFEGFKKIHDALIAKFGDIASANAYYKNVKSMPFLGRNPQVHADLGAKLAAGEKLLKDKGWLDAILAESPRSGGFNVRMNRNAPQLSDHSFGWAVDIDAALNPNVKSFPAAVVKGITGEGAFTGEANAKMSKGGTAEELLPWAEKMRDASTTFKAAFESEATLKQAMIDYLTGQLGMTIKADGLDFEMVKGAKDGGSKAQKKNFSALVDVLAGAHPNLVKAQAEQDDEEREAFVEKNGWKNWPKEKKKRDDARTARADKVDDNVAAAARKEKRDANWGDWLNEIIKYAGEIEREIATKAARFLTDMYGIYKQSFADEKKGTRKSAQTEGTAGTIAANGFINLKPELIAALTGSDGGDLDSLGNTSGTKDFMHFQLKSGDRPALK